MQGIDVFAGAGGMSIGATACGVDVRYAIERDPYAAETFAMNHSCVTLYDKDVREISAAKHLAGLDRTQPLVLFGGPPCQGFSTSNQKNRSIVNEKNWLYQEYLRLVSEVKPDWVIFENVKGLVETEGGFFLDAVLKGFKALGYITSHFVLNSADFGVPQKRNRLFIIGSLHGVSVSTPIATTKKPVTVSQAFKDLPILGNGDDLDEMEYSSAARATYAKSLRGSLLRCSNNVVTDNAPHIVERYSYIPQGGNWEDIPDHLMKNYADKSRCHTGIYRRLKEDEPSVVIGNFRKNMLVHPWIDRGLSVREAARLQSFPDWFRFCGTIGFQQQQVGNAVPPVLAKAVFESILARQ
ncbi:MAG: DNA (cytosine-5-)-methyltransferase [Burkholderiales bacterium RIFCSPLOWO2_12_FULL_61_40]|nr:MAG: DNA (cytosine-5-)-methyltransferase [Burkholderiales bacterium RIFCSPLOWO2_12_FULL_61_40]